MRSETYNYAYDNCMTTDPSDDDVLPGDWAECDKCGMVFNYEIDSLECCPNCKYKGD